MDDNEEDVVDEEGEQQEDEETEPEPDVQPMIFCAETIDSAITPVNPKHFDKYIKRNFDFSVLSKFMPVWIRQIVMAVAYFL